jgi:hypothetical protein
VNTEPTIPPLVNCFTTTRIVYYREGREECDANERVRAKINSWLRRTRENKREGAGNLTRVKG